VTWLLRSATLDDLDAIMAIEESEFTTDAWNSSSMRAELSSPHGHYLVAVAETDPGTVVAYAGLLSPRNSGQGDIQTIAVLPTARRSGLGRALMNALLTEARGRGATEVFLEVRADNPGAKSLYDGLGFEEIAVRPHYYQPDDVDAIVMRLLLPTPTVVPA